MPTPSQTSAAAAEVCGSPSLPGLSQHWAMIGDLPPGKSLDNSEEKQFIPGTNVRKPYFLVKHEVQIILLKSST